MARPDKVSAVAEIAEAFRTSNAAVLTEYRGLSVKAAHPAAPGPRRQARPTPS